MSITKQELEHVLFLSQVVMEGNKRTLMPSTLQTLMYIAKSLDHVDLSEPVTEVIREWIQAVEAELIHESHRLNEIQSNLAQRTKRNPF